MKYNIVTVKFGTKYSSNFVNKLYNDIKLKCTDAFEFYCYTDDPTDIDPNITIINNFSSPTLKGVWNKLRLFDEAMPMQGKTIFLDLDTLINDDIINRLNGGHDWSKLTVINELHKVKKLYGRLSNYDVHINSSVMTWDASNPDIHNVWKHFNTGLRDYYMRKYPGMDRFLAHEDFELAYIIPGYSASRSRFAKNEIRPSSAAIITYEGLDIEFEDLISDAQAL